MPSTQIKCNHHNRQIGYLVVHGFDAKLTLQAEQDWTIEKAKVFREIYAAHPTVQNDLNEFRKRAAEYNLVDWHWNWSTKALSCTGNGYEWFYLIADNRVQAMCIIFHPKNSPLLNDNVFYVDYIAVAYWNRPRPNYIRQFDSLGTVLLSYCVKYSIEQLKYRPGFFLHSLPSAEPYYSKKGLTALGLDAQYHNLRIFEASEACSTAILKEYADA